MAGERTVICDVVGTPEIASRVGVTTKTVRTWRTRGVFPDPDYPDINGLPAWTWPTVLTWLGQTGRIPDGHPHAVEYAVLTGEPPAKHHPVGRRPGSTNRPKATT